MSASYNHPKVKVHVGDGFKFLNDYKNTFDVIITDSSDPEGPAESLFQKPYFQLLHDALREGGVITTQGCTSPYSKVSRVLGEEKEKDKKKPKGFRPGTQLACFYFLPCVDPPGVYQVVVRLDFQIVYGEFLLSFLYLAFDLTVAIAYMLSSVARSTSKLPDNSFVDVLAMRI